MAACNAMMRRNRQRRADSVLRRRRSLHWRRAVAGLRVKFWSTTLSLRVTKIVAGDGYASGALIFELDRFETAMAGSAKSPGQKAYQALESTQKLSTKSTQFEDPFWPDFEEFVAKFCHRDFSHDQAELLAE